MPGIFITGTDTGVGKTFVTALLAHYYQSEGFNVGIMKPVSCGPQKENDAAYLKKLFKLQTPIALMNPVALGLPLAPYIAAKLDKKKINLNKIFSAYNKLSESHDLVLVEGVGGVLVPIARNYYVIDLIKDLKLPTIIVARAGLGTLNHTFSTIDILKKRNIEILGVIMNGFTGTQLSEKTNPQIIEELSGVPVLAKIPWIK